MIETYLQLHSQQTERDLLTALINDVGIYDTLMCHVTKDMFIDGECIMVYDIIKDMEKDGKKPDFSEVGMRLMAKGGEITHFMAIESLSYELTRQRIELLKALAYKRNINRICHQGLILVNDPTADMADFVKLISELNSETIKKADSVMTFGETLQTLRTEISQRMTQGEQSGITTGLHLFDVRYGFHTGDLVVFAGESSQGKSTLATTIARNMALQGTPIAYYSLEMGAKQLTARITARDTLIASSRLLYSKMTNEEYQRFYDKTSALTELPIYYDENSKTSFTKICTSMRMLARKYGVRCCFVDYLQILANGNTDNREQLLGDMARDFKRLAVEEDLCVVILSQLARSKDKSAPDMNRLRGSGQIAEAADIVVTIYRPSVYDIKRYEDGRATEGTALLEIKKGRNIGLGKEVVTFNSELTFFCDYDATQQPKVEYKQNDMPW